MFHNFIRGDETTYFYVLWVIMKHELLSRLLSHPIIVVISATSLPFKQGALYLKHFEEKDSTDFVDGRQSYSMWVYPGSTIGNYSLVSIQFYIPMQFVLYNV